MKIVALNWRDLAHPSAGGAEVLIDRLLIGLMERGHEVTLVCGGPISQHKYEVIGAGGTYSQYFRVPLLCKSRLGDADIVIDIENGLPFFTPLWWRKPSLCLVHHVHSDQWKTRFAAPIAATLRFVEEHVMPAVYRKRTFVSISRSTADSLMKIGVPEGNIRIIESGVDMPTSICPKSTVPMFLSLNRLVPHKRIHLLLEAWKYASSRIPGQFIIAGDGPELEHVRAEAQGIDRISVLGRVSEQRKQELLAQAWFIVGAAHHEGWGLSMMEAAAVGTPALAVDALGIRDSVVTGITGELVCGSEEHLPIVLGDAWVSLTQDTERRQTMEIAARTRAATFSWDRTIARWQVVLNEATSRVATPQITGSDSCDAQRVAVSHVMESHLSESISYHDAEIGVGGRCPTLAGDRASIDECVKPAPGTVGARLQSANGRVGTPDAMAKMPLPGVAGSTEAFEVAIEDVPASLASPPGSPPIRSGALLLPQSTGGLHLEHGSADPAPETVRAGLLQAGPLAIAGLLNNGVGVVLTILLARLLTTHGYGRYNQLVGLFLVISMPGTAVAVAVVRRVTLWVGSGMGYRVADWGRRIQRQGAYAVAAFAVLVVLISPALATSLKQPNSTGVAATLVAGAVFILLSKDRGLLQAHRSYGVLAINLLIEGTIRTAGVIGLVAAGRGAAGAAVGILLAEVTAAIHARVMSDRVWMREGGIRTDPFSAMLRRSRRNRLNGTAARVRNGIRSTFRVSADLRRDLSDRRQVTTDLCVAFVAMGMLAVLQNVDVIVLGRANPGVSGSYAAVSVSSKVLVFGAVVLAGYLVPEAAIRWDQGGHALRQVAVVGVILSVPASMLIVIAIGVPHQFLSLVFAPRYLGAVAAFGPLVLAMICLSATVVMTMYLLAVGQRWITAVLVAGALITTIAVNAAQGQPLATARADLFVQAALGACVLYGFIRIHRGRAVVPRFGRSASTNETRPENVESQTRKVRTSALAELGGGSRVFEDSQALEAPSPSPNKHARGDS